MKIAVLMLGAALFAAPAWADDDAPAWSLQLPDPGACAVQMTLPVAAALATVKRNSTGIGGPPPDTRTVDMARRRYQRGSLKEVGGRWRFMWREDVIQPDGSTLRVLRKEWIGDAGKIGMREARRLADQIVAPLNDRWYRPGMTIEFASFAAEWERNVLPMRKPSTQKNARLHLARYLRPAFADVPLMEIHQGRVQAFVAPLVARMQRHSIENIVSTLSAILTTAKKWGYAVGQFHREDVVLPKVAAPPKRHHFEPETVKRILECARGEWFTLFATAALTGIRPGELLGLARGDLDFQHLIIRVQRANDRGRLITVKSRRSYRDIPMPEPLRPILQRHLRTDWRANPDDLLFTSERGTPLRLSKVVSKRLHPILKQIGVPTCGMHAFRHTAASVLLWLGASPKVVQSQLGHENAKTTLDIYGHLVGDEQRAAVEKMARLLLPVVTAGDDEVPRVQ